MNRFFVCSAVLHIAFFSTIVLANREGLKPIPKFEVYKVSLAPMPQPKVLGITEKINEPPVQSEVKKEFEVKKTAEKAPPKEKGKPSKGVVAKTTSGKKSTGSTKKGLPDGLPDINPQIYTGSGRGFTYSYYLNILLNKIGQNWQNPYKDQDLVLKSIVYFEVDKNGNISNVRLEEDSGNDLYNETAIRAVTLAKKLPPLPEEFTNDYLKVHLEFLTAQ